MASIFDQYEQASQRSKNTNPVNTPLTNSGYISMQLEDDVPMFSKQKMHFVPSDTITHVAVSSDYLVLAMANKKLFTMDLSNPSKYEEIHFGKYMQTNTKLSAIFLDPLGFHILLSFSAWKKDSYPELMYLHRKSTKLKPVSKSKNYEVTEVGWNFENRSESTTGPILLGTSHGLILETEIGPDSDKMFQTGIEQYWRQVFDIGKGTETPITGVQFHRIQFSSKYFVIVTTPKRLYQFIGYANTEDKPMLQSIFNSYLNVPETGFQDIPSTLNYSKLQLFYDKVSKTPKTFAWLTGPGIFYGKLDPTSQENSNSLFTESELISYPPLKGHIESSKNESLLELDPAPLSFVLTEFHALILYSNHIKAISLLNKEVVYEDYYLEAHGKLKNIVKDPVKQSVWAVTDKGIFKYKIMKEDRYVWQIYCEKEMFDLAKQYCGANPAHIDSINVKQAELLFKQGDFEKSASTFADTQSGFEGICLKFLQADKIDALKIYLMKRLHGLGNDEKTLITMIVVWIVELFLSQLAVMRRSDEENTVRYKNIQTDLDVFLNLDKVKKCIKGIKHVIYDLMSSHGDQRNLMKLTDLYEDYENVISQNIYEKNYLAALDTLKDHCKPDMYYQFCPILLQEVPKNTVNVLISKGRVLSPAKLLPGLISCDNDEDHANEIIRYLEYYVQSLGCKDRAIHNYLVSLYAEHRNDALMRYLARQGQDLAVINFDVHYALRLCQEKQLTEACVKLSALLGLWESAIDMAITVNLNLAKSIANMIEDDLELKKKLWLKIAQHELNKNQDVKKGMEFLKECDLIKIEDILPFFSDVVTIDHFRDPICQSLQEYNQQIEDLKIEMEEATRSAEQVRAEIQSFRNRSVIVGVTDVCALCDITLLLRPFYLFPCGHRCHSDCLMHEIQPTLSPARRNKLAELQRKFNSQADANALNAAGIPMREELKNSIDDIVASECLYCGEYMIQSIDKPFIADSDWDRVMKEWE